MQAAIHLKNEPVDRRETHPCEKLVADFWDISEQGRLADGWLKDVVRWTWRVKLLTQLETELMTRLREQS